MSRFINQRVNPLIKSIKKRGGDDREVQEALENLQYDLNRQLRSARTEEEKREINQNLRALNRYMGNRGGGLITAFFIIGVIVLGYYLI